MQILPALGYQPIPSYSEIVSSANRRSRLYRDNEKEEEGEEEVEAIGASGGYSRILQFQGQRRLGSFVRY